MRKILKYGIRKATEMVDYLEVREYMVDYKKGKGITYIAKKQNRNYDSVKKYILDYLSNDTMPNKRVAFFNLPSYQKIHHEEKIRLLDDIDRCL